MNYYLRSQESLALRALDARLHGGDGSGVKALILEGKPGVGKTALGRYYAETHGGRVEYYLCHHWSSDEDLFIGVDVGRVAAGVHSAEEAYRPGVLLRAVAASHEGLVVVVVDELDKAPERAETLLLDFLQTGEVHGPRGEVWKADLNNLVVFITTNGLRPLLEATLRRCFRVRMEYLPPNVEADILRKATGAPTGAIRLVVRMGGVIRTAGETAVSLQELQRLLEDLPVAQSAADVEILLRGWLVKEDGDWEALCAEFKNPAAALWGEWRKAK